MTSHEFAKVLLDLPDDIISFSVYGHTYDSVGHRYTHGPIKIYREKAAINVSCSPNRSGEPIWQSK